MAKKVVLDAGHGGSDQGATASGLQEKHLTLDIAKRIQNKLEKYEVEVIMTRTADKYLSLTERTNIANKANADAFVSVHINTGGGTGFESYIFNGAVSNKTHNLQSDMHSNIMKQIGVADRGKKRANFAVLRQTQMSAILTENLFIDRNEDAVKLKDSKFLDKIAQRHADGIVKFLGLKKGSANGESNETSSYKGNSLVDYLKSTGVDSSFSNRKKLAAQHGISNYRGTAAQNTQLLNKLRAGAAPKTNTKPKGDKKTNSIVDYLKSIHVDSSFANRQKLAERYGIKNYRGTASQNTALLQKMRG